MSVSVIKLSRLLLALTLVVVCVTPTALRGAATLEPPAPDLSAEPSCGSTSSTTPRTAAVARLSKAEYAQTLSDLLGSAVVQRMPALVGLIASIPDDDTRAGFLNSSWSLSADHVAGYLAAANEIGTQLATQPQLRAQLIPCARKSTDINDKCVETFATTFAMRAYRRPLQKPEQQDLIRFYQQRKASGPDRAFADLVARVLMSPYFLFKAGVEPPAGPKCENERSALAYRRASRMAYSMWGSMPDARLMAAADRGDLADDAVVRSELERMWSDGRTRAWMHSFFRQWLHYDRAPVESYSWGFLGNIDRAHLHESAQQELERFIDAVIWEDRGSFRDLMTSRKVITNATSIRRIYGMSDAPAAAVEQAPGMRAGLLTRVAMLAPGFDDASVVKRGAFVRRQLLCDPLTPPDPSQLPPGSLVPPEKDHRLSTRQRWEARTAPNICQGCHRMINPLGLALENYDAIGRARMVEKLPVPDSSPQAYIEHLIDARIVPNLDSRTEPEIEGPAELSAALGASMKANACFARQFDTFVSGRTPEAADLPGLRSLAEAMMQPGGSMHDVMLAIIARHTTQEQ